MAVDLHPGDAEDERGERRDRHDGRYGAHVVRALELERGARGHGPDDADDAVGVGSKFRVLE